MTVHKTLHAGDDIDRLLSKEENLPALIHQYEDYRIILKRAKKD